MPIPGRTIPLLLLLLASCEPLPFDVHDAFVRCFDPAPLSGRFDRRAPLYVVMYRDGTDAAAETRRLAERHRFRPRFVYSGISGFAAELSLPALAGVRCEPSVKSVSHDALSLGD